MSENKTVNLDEITDIKEIKSLMADQFMVREAAEAKISDANKNLDMLMLRMNQLQAEQEKNNPISKP